MHFLTKVLPFAVYAAAAPLQNREVVEKRALSADDTAILSLALYLENLEHALYVGGFANFTDAQYTAAGFPAGFRENVGVLAQQEQTHADLISSVLAAGGQPTIPPCQYSFPYTDPRSFVALANMITSVGIGAYIGGSLSLIDNTTLLEVAASILPNEARHDTFLRDGLGASPFPTPFDTALTGLWAYNLAHTFIVSCPKELSGVVLLPKLMFKGPMAPQNLEPGIAAGTQLAFSWDPSTFFVGVDPSAPLYIAFINQVAPPVFEQVTSTGSGSGTVALPSGLGGAAFAVLTTFSGGLTAMQLSQFGTLAGPAEVQIS